MLCEVRYYSHFREVYLSYTTSLLLTTGQSLSGAGLVNRLNESI